MRFSSRAEYGLRAMVNLAKAYPEQKSIKIVSEEEKISVKYLERLINELRKINLVTSQKGKTGGYILARKPSMIKVGEIIENLEGTIAPMKCVESGKIVQCQCASKVVWNKLGEQIRKTLYGIKLSDLIYPIKSPLRGVAKSEFNRVK